MGRKGMQVLVLGAHYIRKFSDESSDGGHSNSGDGRTLGSRIKTAGGGKQGTRGSSSKSLVRFPVMQRPRLPVSLSTSFEVIVLELTTYSR